MKKELTKNVLEKIKEDHIEPRAKWEFTAKNYLVWLFGVTSIIIGSLSVSVIIYMIKDNDFIIYKNLDKDLINFIFYTLPYFWFIFFTLFILVAHYNIKHTRKGYRYSLPIVVIAVLAGSTIIGVLLYNIGLGEAVDQTLVNKMPLYKKAVMHRQKAWQQVDQGLLAGTIIMVSGREGFSVKDFDHNTWLIDANEAHIAPVLVIQTGEQVKILGEKLPEFNFKAKLIRPYYHLPFCSCAEENNIIKKMGCPICERNNCGMRIIK